MRIHRHLPPTSPLRFGARIIQFVDARHQPLTKPPADDTAATNGAAAKNGATAAKSPPPTIPPRFELNALSGQLGQANEQSRAPLGDLNEVAEAVEAFALGSLKQMLMASPDLRVVVQPDADTPWASSLGPHEAFVVSPSDPEFSQIPPQGNQADPQPSPHYTPAYQRHQASPKPPLQVVVPDSLLVELTVEAEQVVAFDEQMGDELGQAWLAHAGDPIDEPPGTLLESAAHEFANSAARLQLAQRLPELTTTDGNPLFNGTGQLLLDINA